MAASVLAITIPTRASAEAMLLIEAASGKVLHAENATYPWYPASVTKVLTAYVTLTAVKERRLTLDSLLPVSARAAAQAPSKMGFKPGTTVTVDNALKMLMVKSANDVAYVLAEGVGGSVEKFADEMNETSRRLGMTQSNWVNPNGLPAENQISSARDLAILGRAMVRDYPEYLHYWNIPAIKFGKKVMRNTNSLIGRYQGADGGKTGFICASGFNVMASATRNGRRLIAVVLGSPSSPVRGAKTAGMLERGFNRNGVSWLTPSLGTVETLQPIAAAPPDLREANVRQAPQAARRRGCRRRHASRQQQPIRSQFTCRIHAVEPGAGVEHQELATGRTARPCEPDRGSHRRWQEVGGHAGRGGPREARQEKSKGRQVEAARFGGRHRSASSHRLRPERDTRLHADNLGRAAWRVRPAGRPLCPVRATSHACRRGQQLVHELHVSGQRRPCPAHRDACCDAADRRRADAAAAPEGQDQLENPLNVIAALVTP